MRVKVSWRLGAPEEALGVWLVIAAKDVQRAKPPQVLESFAQALCKKRPRLKWRIQYECLQLFSIDGTPLMDDIPLVESLARVSSDELLALPRIRCLSEETTASSSPRGWVVDDGGALAACRLCSGGKVGGDTVLIRTDRRVAGATWPGGAPETAWRVSPRRTRRWCTSGTSSGRSPRVDRRSRHRPGTLCTGTRRCSRAGSGRWRGCSTRRPAGWTCPGC